MQRVRPKKQLGQHFLKDKNIAQKIVSSLTANDANTVLEIGPGMGVLTEFLLDKFGDRLYASEIDSESIDYLKLRFPNLKSANIVGDFMALPLLSLTDGKVAIIGNFPYYISSQIFFKILDDRETVSEVVCMIQREVAQRICEPPGTKTYGILSVLLQAYFDIQYLFTVHEGVFAPPPKVKSAVIRLTRNRTETLSCNEKLFVRVVKAGFNQRRKTLRNSIRAAFHEIDATHPLFEKRPEQLSVAEFVELTKYIEGQLSPI